MKHHEGSQLSSRYIWSRFIYLSIVIMALSSGCITNSADVQPSDTPLPSPTLVTTLPPTAPASDTPLPSTASPSATPLPPTPSPSATPLTPTASPTPSGPFQRIFIIIMENKSQASVLADPYFADLAKRGTSLTHYFGVAHPSEPNYLALIAGDTYVKDDGSYNLSQSNLVDLLEPANISWRAYLENYPGACFAGDSQNGQYMRKHNPFISFDDIRTNAKRCANLVEADQVITDIAAGLPQFSFYVPNMNDDGHDTSVSYSANWLKGFLEPKMADPRFMDGTLVVVTFDETDDFSQNPDTSPLYTVLLGPMVQPNSIDATNYTHYGLLRTVEETFNLGTLHRNDASAIPFAACNFAGGCVR